MRIGLLIYGRLDQASGGYLYDQKLVTYLRSRGHQVEVIPIPWRGYWRSMLDNFSPLLFIRLANARLDVLIQDELNHPSLFLLNRRLKKVAAYPILSIVHLLRFTEPRGPLSTWFCRAIERRYLNSVDGFVFNSRDTQRLVRRLVPRRVPAVLATPGGDRLAARTNAARMRARTRRPGPLQVLFLGNLIRRKAPHLLLQGAAALDGKVHVHLAGRLDMEPAYVHSLRRLAGSNVTFHGFVDGVALATLMRRSHVLALPSAYEGFGIAYLEGMAFGLPALATRAGAARELVRHGHNGYLLPPGDAEALTRTLAKLHSNRRLLAMLGQHALQTYAMQPTWDQSLQKIEQFLSSYNPAMQQAHRRKR